MRLIDADRLKAEIMGWCVVTDDLFGMGKYHEREIVLQAIEESPTIDAVPVVRCKECRFRNTSWYDKRDMLESFYRWDRDESPNDDDYCSYGAKMESEDST